MKSKNKILTIVIVLATLLLAGIAVFTATRIFQTRKESVSPARPSSKPQAQTTNQCKFDIMLIIDRTGSMEFVYEGIIKLTWAKQAAIALVNKLKTLPAGSSVRVGVTPLYNPSPGGASDIKPLTNDLDSVITYINQIEIQEPAGTCISCALDQSNTSLSSSKIVGIKQYSILLSDGCGNRSKNCTSPQCRCRDITSTRQEALEEANEGRANGITYYAVGFESTEGGLDCNQCKYDKTTLINITGSENNLSYRPNPQTWAQAFVDIIDDICVPVPTTTPTTTPTTSTQACPVLSFSLETTTPTPTATTTGSPTATPTPTSTTTPTPTSTPTSTSTPGITLVSCNGSCDVSSDCKSGLTCPDGVCRNPSCLAETDCTCPVAQATTEPSMPNAGVSLPTVLGISTSIFLLIISLALAL